MDEAFLEKSSQIPPLHIEGTAVLTVTELTRCIRTVIETEDLFADVWVRGEISNLSKHTSGHTYFCLKDESALIRCVIWRNTLPALPFELADGMCVILRGRITVYEKQGQYQIVVSEVKPGGIGTLYAAFEKLKERLRTEGLFEQARKRQIPQFPQTIALVTSPTGAAVHDMISVATRRFPNINILVIPTLMQGEGADVSVVESLQVADSIPYVDTIVVGRGGGSLEDLWTFDMESVVRAIAACKKPVVSAIGHETDYTLADLAADFRAPTPSAAMEYCVPDRRELSKHISSQVDAIMRAVAKAIESCNERLATALKSKIFAHPESLIQDRWQMLDTYCTRLAFGFDRIISQCKARLGELCGKLETLSPLRVLSRGYAIVKRSKDGLVVKNIDDIAPGDVTETMVLGGIFTSEVKELLEGWERDG